MCDSSIPILAVARPTGACETWTTKLATVNRSDQKTKAIVVYRFGSPDSTGEFTTSPRGFTDNRNRNPACVVAVLLCPRSECTLILTCGTRSLGRKRTGSRETSHWEPRLVFPQTPPPAIGHSSLAPAISSVRRCRPTPPTLILCCRLTMVHWHLGESM